MGPLLQPLQWGSAVECQLGGLSGRDRAVRLAAAAPTEASTCSCRTARLTADVLALVVGPERQECRAALHLDASCGRGERQTVNAARRGPAMQPTTTATQEQTVAPAKPNSRGCSGIHPHLAAGVGGAAGAAGPAQPAAAGVLGAGLHGVCIPADALQPPLRVGVAVPGSHACGWLCCRARGAAPALSGRRQGHQVQGGCRGAPVGGETLARGALHVNDAGGRCKSPPSAHETQCTSRAASRPVRTLQSMQRRTQSSESADGRGAERPRPMHSLHGSLQEEPATGRGERSRTV